MNTTQSCHSCSSAFEISASDLAFLEKVRPVFNGQKILIPPPTLCPPCRQQRHLAFRNERNLYNRKCDLTGKSIISNFSENKPYKIYDTQAWYSDTWDPMEYGINYDFNRPFFDQFTELQKRVPRLALFTMFCENSPYNNHCWHLKNCHLCFNVGPAEDCLYSHVVYYSTTCVDCLYTRNSERCYSLIDCEKCYGSAYLQDCNNCSDAYFSFDCSGCQNILFCSNLRNKTYHAFNKPVSKEEFTDIKNRIFCGSHETLQKAKQQYSRLIENSIKKENHNKNVQDCSGDYLQNSKNLEHCYDVDTSEDLKYCNTIDEKVLSSMDVDNAALAELLYECTAMAGVHNLFSMNCWTSNNLLYCDLVQSSNNCFGSVSLKSKSYCILNKQYSQTNYEALIPKILNHMKHDGYQKNGRAMNPSEASGSWGEFFPMQLSPFAYNETFAQQYFPITKEMALLKNLKWQEDTSSNASSASNSSYELPNNLSDTPETITKEKLTCQTCQKPYTIIPQELSFYKQLSLPIPRSCHTCRHFNRMSMRTPRKIFESLCSKCQKHIHTSYTPETKNVYCEKCYLEAVYE